MESHTKGAWQKWGRWGGRNKCPPLPTLVGGCFSYLYIQGQGCSGHLPFGQKQQGREGAIDRCVHADLGQVSRPHPPRAPYPRPSWPPQAVGLALPSLVLNGGLQYWGREGGGEAVTGGGGADGAPASPFLPPAWNS